MSHYLNTLLWGLGVFIVVFLCNYFLYYQRGYKNISKQKKKKKMKKIEDFLGFSYLIPKYKLDLSKVNLKAMFIVLSSVNAFIIGVVFVCVTLIDWSIAFSLMLGFVLIFGLIYGIYEILGRILRKKGRCKNV